ncbi:MAG: serine/threonine protein kinase, partial [Planctomycetes bacterium]|nr:serine/threonine protein kinase [Planctomycetota bacterium]
MSERKPDSPAASKASYDRSWVEVCWSDMRHRWSLTERPRVEDYLPPAGSAAIPPELMTDLVYGEYMLRKEHGETPSHDEYGRRFPELRANLLRQFALDDALSNDGLLEYDSTLASQSAAPGATYEPTPDRIGKYVVISRVGAGGQADVFRAVHPALKREVILKLGRGGTAAARREHLEAEAQILAQIEHPNLARIYDLDFHDQRPLLVMEYIRGRTLDQYVRDVDPGPAASAGLVAKIARGLAVVHQRGIVHLDVKPGNVIVDESGEPHLIDFGLAYLCDAWDAEEPADGGVRGTLPFMSPEQAAGDRGAIDARSDVFALGAILFFLLTKCPPYPRCAFSELLARVRKGDWERDRLYRRNVPPAVRDICLRAMSEAPDARYATANTLARELDRFRRRRSPLRSWIVAAVTVVAGGLAIVAATHDDSDAVAPDPARRRTDRLMVDFQPALAVEVHDEGRYLPLSAATPLRNEDELRIVSQVPAGTYYAIFLLTSEGELRELQHEPPADRARTVHYPGQGKTVPLIGQPGTEVILICGRQSGPIRLEEMRTLWSNAERWPALPEQAVLRTGAQATMVVQQGRDFGDPLSRPDAVSAVRDRLEQL